METVTAIIITKNEAENIAACLDSLKWVDEIIVVDSGSVDDTCAIAQRYTENVVIHAWSGYSEQKNFGHTLAHGDWILSIDADERISPELQREIQTLLAGKPASTLCDAYRIPIRDWMFGKFADYGSWPHQRHIRFYRKGRAVWQGSVHEGVQVQGKIGSFHNPMLHYSHTTIHGFIHKLNRYTDIEAEDMYSKGIRVSLVRAVFGAIRAFLGQYIRLQGFRDGGHGLILAIMMAFYYFTTRAKLWSIWYMREHKEQTANDS